MNIKKTKVGIAINGINEIHENKETFEAFEKEKRTFNITLLYHKFFSLRSIDDEIIKKRLLKLTSVRVTSRWFSMV
jgi:hypothetical protein